MYCLDYTVSAFQLFRKQSGKHFCIKSYTSANIKKLLNNTKNTYFPSLRQCTGERRTESVEGETSHEPQWVLCDASCVGGLCRCPSTGSPFGHHPRLSMVCPRWGQWVSTREVYLTLPHTHRKKFYALSVGNSTHSFVNTKPAAK